MMGILDVLRNLFPWGIIVAVIAVLAGIWWQKRQRQNRVNKPKMMQSSTTIHSENQVDGEKKSSGPPVPQRRLAKILFQSSEKVSSGSPSVFKLSMRTESREGEKSISRYIMGGGPNGGPEKVLLLVGATGAGKTTLINAMVNYILGVDWKDEFRYKIVIKNEDISQNQTQKKPITAYTFYPMEGSALSYALTIIDTPGYGDSKGLHMDRITADQIKEFLTTAPPHGIDHLDGVGFVAQASMSHLTPGQEYVFDSILSIFGKDVLKNIFMLLTFADSQQLLLQKVINKTNVPSDKCFQFNNSALYAENTEEAEELFNAVFWKMGYRSFKRFFAELENSKSVTLQLTREIWKKREQLQTSIEQLNTMIAMNRSRIDQLRQEKLILQQHEKDVEANKEFTYTVQVKKTCKIDLTGTGKYAMTCLSCNFSCDKNCPISDDGMKSNCEAFDESGNCKACPGHCNVSDHRSLSYHVVYETVDETKTCEDLKKKYDEAVSLKSQAEGRIRQLNEDIQNEEKQIGTIKNQIQQGIRHLDEIALKPNPLTQIEYLEQLIESERQEATPGSQQRLYLYEEAKCQAERFCSKVKFTEAEKEVDADRPLRLAERILQISEKISTGSPSVYKLPTEVKLEREKGMIVKKTIGSPSILDGRGTEKVLMVVGATGAGKTTLINGMINYIFGVEWADTFRYKLVVEDNKVSQANSQTKSITAYTFQPMEGATIPYTFTIIDTPGFGDTQGLKRDKEIAAQIKEFFSIPPPEGIDHLDGIGFVTQASLARLTPTQEYIFDSILSIFGRDVVKNIFMLVTFADGQQPPVMEAVKKAKIPAQKFYKFNNSALFARNAEDVEEDFDAMFWKMGARSFKKFFTEFEKSEGVSLQLTQEVLKEREQLQTLIEGLNPQIRMGLSKIEEMRQEENVLKQHETEIETNKSFTYSVEITEPIEIDLRGTGKHTTTCLRCNYTCHENCKIASDSDKYRCCAMDENGDCEICTEHCHWSEHRNLPYLIEYKTVKQTRTSDDLKRKYEAALSGKDKVQGMIQKIDEYLMAVHTRVLTMIVKAQKSLQRLDKIALKPNPLTQMEYLELLIDSEKNEAKPGWKQRVDYYEEAKHQAQVLSKLKDIKAAEKKIKEKASSGEKWYSRFKFW